MATTSMATRGASSATRMTEPAGQPIRWQHATIARIARRTPTISSFFFRLPAPFDFVAGQHVDVRLTAADGYSAQRSYSIASAPGTDGEIELAIEKLDDGEVSPFFHDVAAVGDEIELRGPLGGHFVWSVEDGGPLLLVGGGSGVVPLMSMARYRAERQEKVPALLFLSARTLGDALFRDELLHLEARPDGLALAFSFTREPPSRPDDYGRRIDQAMAADLLSRLGSAPRYVFVCGSNAFVSAAADALIEAGLAAAIIKTERYGG
jgi:ferredoxin-NADP reductase